MLTEEGKDDVMFFGKLSCFNGLIRASRCPHIYIRTVDRLHVAVRLD